MVNMQKFMIEFIDRKCNVILFANILTHLICLAWKQCFSEAESHSTALMHELRRYLCHVSCSKRRLSFISGTFTALTLLKMHKWSSTLFKLSTMKGNGLKKTFWLDRWKGLHCQIFVLDHILYSLKKFTQSTFSIKLLISLNPLIYATLLFFHSQRNSIFSSYLHLSPFHFWQNCFILRGIMTLMQYILFLPLTSFLETLFFCPFHTLKTCSGSLYCP